MEEVVKVPAELDLSQISKTEQMAKAISSSTPVESLNRPPMTTITQETPKSPAETKTPPPPEPHKETKPEIELDVGEIPEEEKMDQVPLRESPTIISWSAGKSVKKVKSKGFFLWRFLNKLFNR